MEVATLFPNKAATLMTWKRRLEKPLMSKEAATLFSKEAATLLLKEAAT
jgi:hypothetical protein